MVSNVAPSLVLEDVLIGGSTTIDADDDALMDAIATWTTNDSYDDRVAAVDALMSVLDDEEVDNLTGSAGRDLFYEGIGDDLTDVKNNEDVL